MADSPSSSQACLNPDCQEDNTHKIENCPWMKCKHCKKLGHSKPDCPDYKCSICFKNGHLEEQHHLDCAVCDTQYNHDTEDCPMNKKCLNCGKEGHIKSKCPQINCTKCGENGHFLHQHDLFCQVCQSSYQHNTENCRNIPPCKTCGQYGHFKNACPKSGQGSPHRDQESPYDPCDEIIDDDTSSIEEIEVFSSNSKSKDLGSNPQGSSGGSGMKLLSVRADLFSDENSAGPSASVEDSMVVKKDLTNPKGSSNRSQKSRSQDKASSSSINRRSKSPTAQRSSRSQRSQKSKDRDQYSSSPSPPPVNKTASPASSSAQGGAGSNPARVLKKPNIGFPASFAARKKSADSPKRNSATPSLSPSPQRSNSPSLGRSGRSPVGSRRSKSPHGSRRSPPLRGSRRSPQPRSPPRERFETTSGMRRLRRSPSPIR